MWFHISFGPPERVFAESIHKQGLDNRIETTGSVLKIGGDQLSEIRNISFGTQDGIAMDFELSQRCNHGFDRGNLYPMGFPIRITDGLAKGPNIRPKFSRRFRKSWIRFHDWASSKRRMTEENEMPIALQTSRSSTISNRRSPDSYLLTND
jgi:hypothetical protein